MRGSTWQGWLCLFPIAAGAVGCASYRTRTGTDQSTNAVANVYVETSPNAWEADPSIKPSIVAFNAGLDGKLTQVQTLNLSEALMIGQGGMVFTSDYRSRAIHRYAIAQDGSLRGPVSTLYPAQYDTTGCGAPTGHGMLDPGGTYLSVELEDHDKNCDVWQTYRLDDNGPYQFLGEDSSNLWYWRDGGVGMGFPGVSPMSKDGKFAYASGGDSGGSFLVAMKRDASGVLRIWKSFTWPYDTQYQWQPGGALIAANNDLVLPMHGITNANWNDAALASFTVDARTGDLQQISTYDNMPKVSFEATGVAFSPQGDMIAIAGDGVLQTFTFQNDGPATPSATAQLPPGQWPNGMLWDSSHHLYLLTQTSLKQPAIAQFSLFVFTAADGLLTPAPGSPWNVPNANVLLVVPKG
jgi:6-phosphogluconolactonase (cycloisomerase 2 family)